MSSSCSFFDLNILVDGFIWGFQLGRYLHSHFWWCLFQVIWFSDKLPSIHRQIGYNYFYACQDLFPAYGFWHWEQKSLRSFKALNNLSECFKTFQVLLKPLRNFQDLSRTFWNLSRTFQDVLKSKERDQNKKTSKIGTYVQIRCTLPTL